MTKCAACRLPAEISQGYTVASALFHADCFKCSVCQRQLTASPFPPVPGTTVKASTTDPPELFCLGCAGPEFEARGLLFSADHTLAGPPGFGQMMSTTVASTTFTKPNAFQDMSQTVHAVAAGASTTGPRQCPGCCGARWVAYGIERARCVDCVTIF